MPADQRGSVYPTSRGFGVRWYDEGGARRRKAGFSSRSAARAWFRDVETPRMRGETLAPSPLTLAEFSSRFLERYAADRAPATVRSLQWRLVRPLREFGDLRLTELRTGELAAWEASLPPRFRHDVVRALRMVLDAAVAWEHLARNPAKATGRNPAPPVLERSVLEPAEVEKLAAEMRSPHDVAAVVGAWCYLRPAELLALERRDVGDGVLDVRGTLVSYLWLYRVGDLALVSSILGHGDHLTRDVMYQLFQGAVEKQAGSGGYFVYNLHSSGTDGLRYFKQKLGFEPMEVAWQL